MAALNICLITRHTSHTSRFNLIILIYNLFMLKLIKAKLQWSLNFMFVCATTDNWKMMWIIIIVLVYSNGAWKKRGGGRGVLIVIIKGAASLRAWTWNLKLETPKWECNMLMCGASIACRWQTKLNELEALEYLKFFAKAQRNFCKHSNAWIQINLIEVQIIKQNESNQ